MMGISLFLVLFTFSQLNTAIVIPYLDGIIVETDGSMHVSVNNVKASLSKARMPLKWLIAEDRVIFVESVGSTSYLSRMEKSANGKYVTERIAKLQDTEDVHLCGIQGGGLIIIDDYDIVRTEKNSDAKWVVSKIERLPFHETVVFAKCHGANAIIRQLKSGVIAYHPCKSDSDLVLIDGITQANCFAVVRDTVVAYAHGNVVAVDIKARDKATEKIGYGYQVNFACSDKIGALIVLENKVEKKLVLYDGKNNRLTVVKTISGDELLSFSLSGARVAIYSCKNGNVVKEQIPTTK